ncbi:hypothetical protein [Tepidimicrobium xylanilyticum]|uniref:hypothetical protein n=1 Tax=Tepidimicrobium xylanilyticum TaxID=1123352 RepID=UPI0026539AF2|nr:hypothetical protein [Tepidimicrobium xylanilyticum]GMG96726.1 hypothetical protein EN5CB1_15520 [Tepidimicrobium xylanilyticum]
MSYYERSYYDRELTKKDLDNMATALEGIIERKNNESNLRSYLANIGLTLLGFSKKIGNAAAIASILISIFQDDAGYEDGMNNNIIRTYTRMNRVYRTMDGEDPREDRYILCRCNMVVMVIEGVEIPVYFLETGFMDKNGQWVLAG